ncbi:MAG: ECF transporter S component [Oscillospiraceae bacterium]|nr:ECF transporter S component [Oscillospiraceae bacterium]
MNRKSFGLRDLVMTGLLSALVFAGCLIQIPAPVVIGGFTRFHLGGIMCLLAGFMLGPVKGGFAAGIGCAFFAFTTPAFIPLIPFTFAFRFAQAYVCAVISWAGGRRAKSWQLNIAAAVCGSVLYLILHVGQNFMYDYYLYRMEIETAMLNILNRSIVSGINALISVVGSVPLVFILRKALGKSGLM